MSPGPQSSCGEAQLFLAFHVKGSLPQLSAARPLPTSRRPRGQALSEAIPSHPVL